MIDWHVIALAALGVVEAIVYPWRYRAAVNGSRLENGASAMVVTLIRVAFVWLGASAVMRDSAWWLVVSAYVVPATAATVLVPTKRK